MIRLHFKVDPVLLAFNVIAGSVGDHEIYKAKIDPSACRDFQNEAWNLNVHSYEYFSRGLNQADVLERSIVKQAQDGESFLAESTHLATFKPVLGEAISALSLVREEWENNYAKTFDMMKELTGLELDKDIDVYITHPLYRTGMNYNNNLYWTYRLDFPNYNTIYLWHEVMHGFIKPLEGADHKGNPEHVAVQLLTDNEMRVRLNGGTYPPLEGHDWLLNLSERLMPAWRDYLKESPKNIETFLKIAREEYKKNGLGEKAK